MNVISVYKKSNNVRGCNYKDSTDNRSYAEFQFKPGENFVPEKIFNKIKDTKFFKEQVKIKEFTIDNTKLSSGDLNLDINDKELTAKVLTENSIGDVKKKIFGDKGKNQGILDLETLYKLKELDTRAPVINFCEKKIKEIMSKP